MTPAREQIQALRLPGNNQLIAWHNAAIDKVLALFAEPPTYTLIHSKSGSCTVMDKATLNAFAAENDMAEWQIL